MPQAAKNLFGILARAQKRIRAACVLHPILIRLLLLAHKCRAGSESVDLLPIQ